MALTNKTVQDRSQDYLVGNQSQNGNQNTLQAFNLNAPSYSPNVRSGGGGSANIPSLNKDFRRQSFNARQRQVMENRPVNFELKNNQDQKTRAGTELYNQFTSGLDKVNKREGTNFQDFLPDFQKAFEKDDEEAQQRTAQRLNNSLASFTPEQVKTNALDDQMAFMSAPTKEAFLTELLAQRQSGLTGSNRLDAAILDASGVGRMAFEAERQKVGDEINFMTKNYNDGIRQRLQSQEAEYKQAQDALRGSDIANRDVYDNLIKQRQDEYKNRDVTKELLPVIEKARQEAARLGNDKYFQGGGAGLSVAQPFVDRELSKEEAFNVEEARRYNDLMDLLGGNAIQRIDRQPSFQENSIISALLAEAARRQDAPEVYNPPVTLGRATDATYEPKTYKPTAAEKEYEKKVLANNERKRQIKYAAQNARAKEAARKKELEAKGLEEYTYRGQTLTRKKVTPRHGKL
jgi:hypothetical protein